MKQKFYSKHVLVAILLCLIAFFAKAQGINEFWGMTTDDGFYEQGTIFTATQNSSKLTARHQFGYEKEGAFIGDFVEYNGEFYATAVNREQDDFERDEGYLFKWNPATNEYKVLHRFKIATGNRPTTSLILKNNKLYGTTKYGGINDGGVIYEFDLATGNYTKKADFSPLAQHPWAYGSNSLTLMNGKFYGVIYADTGSDGDLLYEWDPDTNTFGNLLRGSGASNAYGTHEPFTKMTVYNNKLYGATNDGGSHSLGEIVEWDPAANTYVAKTLFEYPMGQPISPLTEKDGKFYGIASKGELYEWDPVTNKITVKQTLPSGIAIDYPAVGFTLLNGKFYGQASGGTSGQGFIYEWDPTTNVLTNRFNYTNGRAGIFSGEMLFWQGKFYGRRPVGVASNYSTEMFEWDPVSNAFAGRFVFNVSEGRAAKGGFTKVGGKLYGMASRGGLSDQGVIFEFDPQTSAHKRLHDLDTEKGWEPLGSLIEKNGKLYGMAQRGGVYNSGTLFELDLQTNTFTKKIDFVSTNGKQPVGSLVEKDGKFYGMTAYGGYYDYGVIFEWDPATNAFTKKLDMNEPTGSRPQGDLTLKDGKFYGMTSRGGVGLGGVLFEWDPATNIYTKQKDLNGNTGYYPNGSLIVFNNKLYGFTSVGGTNGSGTILEWDPAANMLQIRFQGGSPLRGAATISNGKFYYTSGNPGFVGEWDPVTGVWQDRGYFNGTFGSLLGNRPAYSTVAAVPVPVSAGSPGQCLPLAASTIGAGNAQQWVAITDASGNAVAEIKANGNDMGTVNSSLYVHCGPVRQNEAGQYFLGRNVTLTPATAPGSLVDVRIYIKQEEYAELVAANNADSEMTPITDISQIGVYHISSSTCAGTTPGSADLITASVEPWNGDYVFSFKVNSFSTFYFAKKGPALPVRLINFKARLQENDGLLTWETAEESNFSHFELQRSVDSRSFQMIGNVSPLSSTKNGYSFTDTHLSELDGTNAYYRLKMIDLDGTFAYSGIVQLALPFGTALLYPNPTADELKVNLHSKIANNWQLTDSGGNAIMKGTSNGGEFKLDVRKLRPGVYFLRFDSGQATRTFKMVKN